MPGIQEMFSTTRVPLRGEIRLCLEVKTTGEAGFSLHAYDTDTESVGK